MKFWVCTLHMKSIYLEIRMYYTEIYLKLKRSPSIAALPSPLASRDRQKQTWK
jgi:hypothetical protein